MVWDGIPGNYRVIQDPNGIPYLIARPQTACVFSLTNQDIRYIFANTAVRVRDYQLRQWDGESQTRSRITDSDAPNQPPLHLVINVDTKQRVGGLLTQGLGIVGPGYALAVVEEIGYWPDQPGFIATKVFDWKRDRLAFGKIPISYLNPNGVIDHTKDEALDEEIDRKKVEELAGGSRPSFVQFKLGNPSTTQDISSWSSDSDDQ